MGNLSNKEVNFAFKKEGESTNYFTNEKTLFSGDSKQTFKPWEYKIFID